MIHVIPGFLGLASDFEFLSQNFEVEVHDLRRIDAEKICTQVGPDDILLGYSLGGRVSLEVAQSLAFDVKKLILLASHPGLKTQTEKMDRKKWEKIVLSKLKEDPSAFFDWWNALPVFALDKPLPIRDLAGWAEVFDRYRLSDQEDYTEAMEKHASRITYLFGKNDKKYSQLALEKIAPLGVKCLPLEAGHRVFQNPEAVLEILRQEIP